MFIQNNIIFWNYLIELSGGGWSETGKLGMSSRNSFVAVIEDTKVFIIILTITIIIIIIIITNIIEEDT